MEPIRWPYFVSVSGSGTVTKHPYNLRSLMQWIYESGKANDPVNRREFTQQELQYMDWLAFEYCGWPPYKSFPRVADLRIDAMAQAFYAERDMSNSIVTLNCTELEEEIKFIISRTAAEPGITCDAEVCAAMQWNDCQTRPGIQRLIQNMLQNDSSQGWTDTLDALDDLGSKIQRFAGLEEVKSYICTCLQNCIKELRKMRSSYTATPTGTTQSVVSAAFTHVCVSCVLKNLGWPGIGRRRARNIVHALWRCDAAAYNYVRSSAGTLVKSLIENGLHPLRARCQVVEAANEAVARDPLLKHYVVLFVSILDVMIMHLSQTCGLKVVQSLQLRGGLIE